MASWQEFANGYLGIGLAEKDILFVSGFTKTTVWATTAFSDSTSNGELFISGGCFVPSTSGEFHVTMSRSVSASVFSRVGPPDRLTSLGSQITESGTQGGLPCDQCIFLNFYRMKTRALRSPTVLRAAGGVEDLDFPDEDDDDTGSGHTSPSEVASSGSDEESLVFTQVHIVMLQV